MSKGDNRPDAGSSDDALSATGMFYGSFRHQEEDPFEQPAPAKPPAPQSPFAPNAAAPPGTSQSSGELPPGEFTKIFGAPEPPPPARYPQPPAPPQAPFRVEAGPAEPGEVTAMFGRPEIAHDPIPFPPTTNQLGNPAPSGPPPAAQRVRGYSSPGSSSSASAEGSFTQMFRQPAPAAPAPPPVPEQRWVPPIPEQRWVPESATNRAPTAPTPEAPGVTELFRALSPNQAPVHEPQPPFDRPISFMESRAATPAANNSSGESFTVLIQRLTEHTPIQPLPSQPAPPPQTPPPAEQGEFTRIIARDQMKTELMPTPAAAPAPAAAPPAFAPPVVAPPPAPAAALPAAPKAPAAPALPPPPKSKLQELLPMLLVLNGFLMVVLIVLVVFALMRK